MKIENLALTWGLLTNSTEKGLLVGFSPIFEYDIETKRRTDKQTGFSYDIVLPEMGYEKISVKVLTTNKKAIVEPNELEEQKAIECTFNGFKAKFFKNFKTGDYSLTASADAIVLLNEDLGLLK